MITSVRVSLFQKPENAGEMRENTKEITRPICDWVHENQKAINTLEQLLGTVRKAEKRTQNRTYKNKTKVMDGLLK